MLNHDGFYLTPFVYPVANVDECDALFNRIGHAVNNSTQNAVEGGKSEIAVYVMDMIAIQLSDGTVMPIINILN